MTTERSTLRQRLSDEELDTLEMLLAKAVGDDPGGIGQAC